mmetsp:Transcript_14686/g.30051  ORF Transcript_14686/g.30051 Transcript_14686/m.30051 type:complete len:587 (-) Transcript_14686:145-1905(-)|eukprot:CAMPEP_0171334160 /NCGR_PEP_ID=MMETSP0878-20121228/4490_1 /TAXON_ID=67004 /ORGANISM="Thalassiosira weissflogii, Strain CCMP1336" /LENGTH=586 /DNA_ID=CAMNT_0011835223 /DNA_START=81 /DNA_END=1841 /DNA_ORIENTATION=-
MSGRLIASFILIESILSICALVHPVNISGRASPQAAIACRNPRPSSVICAKSNASAHHDLLKTLELKDEALIQAQTAVSSLETALESAVTNLENMHQHLRLKVSDLEKELSSTRQELSGTRNELDKTKAKLVQSQRALDNAEERIRQLEASLSAYEGDSSGTSNSRAKPKAESNPWQLWSSPTKPSVPILNDWVVIKGSIDGEIQISGKVTNHPEIPDGDAIVTSPLADSAQPSERKIITTSSGSRYRLGAPLEMPTESRSMGVSRDSNVVDAKDVKEVMKNASRSIEIKDLTGETLGNGKYLLAGAASPSVNGRSFIQKAYRSSPAGKPMGEALVIKVSGNKEAMKREFANYQKVSGGLKKGSFIRRVEFLPMVPERPDKSALVMQRGVADVKAFMPKVGGRLEGEVLFNCAMTALRCVEALHASRLVWNDLKTENFVVIENDKTGQYDFRGIDLESCMPVRTTPVDYTPEACPPEFAESFVNGDAESFLLEYSYDVWSYGMFLYEISTGRGFFDGMKANDITRRLPNFEPNVDAVPDDDLADLILQCLARNPKDRPSFVRIARHPYLSNSPFNKPTSIFDIFTT